MEILFSDEANVMLQLYIGNVVFQLPKRRDSAGEARWKPKVGVPCSTFLGSEALFFKWSFSRNVGKCAEQLGSHLMNSKVLPRDLFYF